MSPPASVATLPVVRALLDEARRKNYSAGTLGIRARPQWPGADEFEHQGVPVKVVPCVSTLAVREALRERGNDRWLVILTDRDDTDLGAGVRSHLVWHRLRTPDPWDAVLHRFAASALDPALTTVPGHRDIAVGLLACTPVDGGWPPAPGGVLTREHALGSVAGRFLQLGAELDAAAVLDWTAQLTTAGFIADLRALAGDPLTEAVLDWVTRQVGSASVLVRSLVRAGKGGTAVPLGLVLATLLVARAIPPVDDVVAREALVRLEPDTGGPAPARGSLESLAAASTRLLSELLRQPDQRSQADRLLVAADDLLAKAGATVLAAYSALLPAGLTARLSGLAAALCRSVEPPDEVDRPVIESDRLAPIETAWQTVEAHALAAADPRVPAFAAAVRLARWLSLDSTLAATDLSSLHRRHLDSDAWVDSAVNDASSGVVDAELAAALFTVLAAVRRRRDRHDVEFARALAVHLRDDEPGEPGALHVEDLLATVVLPLAKREPVLLLVLDGMSAAVGNEVVASVVRKVTDGWSEMLPAHHARRIGAISVLPSITELSRTSLLCGELRVGGQDVEQRGYAELARAHGLIAARLFHKKPLDTSQPGFAVAPDVGAAIDDQAGQPLVTCILNTIDDALDRSDPAGTVWTAEAIKHLAPLLERARLAGRVVVLTSDHGHIVERRQGQQRSYPVISSGRSRAESGSIGADEVLATGRRVLSHDGRVVLAVNEQLRYGPLKAGYHGGAAPAEVVIPVYFLVSGGNVDRPGLIPAAPPEPSWWFQPVTPAPLAAPPSPAPAPARAAPPTLFDLEEPAPSAHLVAGSSIADAVISSSTYAEQRQLAGRVSVTDSQVRQLLAALLATADRRLPPTAAAVALGIAPTTLRGAVLHVARLLNVEGYAVLSLDVDGATVVLDEALLREQFGL